MRTVAGHTVTELEVGDTRADGDDGTHVAVAKWQRLPEFIKNGLHRRAQSVGFYFVQYHFYLIGLLPGLV